MVSFYPLVNKFHLDNTVEQFEIAMDDFNTCLIAAGGKFSHVTKVRVFLTDINDRS